MLDALILAALAVVSGDAPSAIQPVTLEAAANAARACVGGTHDLAPLETRLKGTGWGEGALEGGKEQMHVFAKDGVVMLVGPDVSATRSTCAELAKIAPSANGAAVLTAFDAALGKHVTAPNGQVFWMLGDEIASVTGDSATAIQGLRFVVTPNSTEGSK